MLPILISARLVEKRTFVMRRLIFAHIEVNQGATIASGALRSRLMIKRLSAEM